MATKGDLYQQARSVDGKDFDDWVQSVQNTLQLNDRSQQCLTLLRQLCVFVSVTKYSRNLAPTLYTLLQSVVSEPEQGPPRIRLMASCILRELCPSDNVVVKDFNPPVQESSIPYLLPVLLAQTNGRGRISQLALEVFRWLTETGYEEELSLAALSTLYAICSHDKALERFTEDHYRALNLHLVSCLKQASTNCTQVPTSSLFSAGGKKQAFPVKEIDGSVSQNFFTLLNIGGYYSSDQLLNIHSFSFLRRWILVTHMVGTSMGVGPSPAPIDYKDGERSLSRGEGYRSASVTSSLNLSTSFGPQSFISSPLSSLPNPFSSIPPSGIVQQTSMKGRARQQLREAVLQYCLRVLEQCERKPTKTAEDDLAVACLYECIAILDLQCVLHRPLLSTVFLTCKKMYIRWSQDPSILPNLLLMVVKLLVRHSDYEVFDTQAPLENIFGQVLNSNFANPSFTFDTVEYLLEHQEYLCRTTSIFTKFFPNFLKILAWAPVTYVAEFLQLLPSFISSGTALEVLHSLLDLPCLTAVLQVQQFCLDANTKPQFARCIAAFQEPSNKLMFGHFLRSESGRGDTIDRLTLIQQLLSDLSQHPRVTGAAEITPLLLRVFFQTVLCGGDALVISQVVGVVLERNTLLFNIPAFQEGIKKVFAEQLLEIFKAYPGLVVDFHRDLREHLSNLRTLATGGEPLYLHLAWAVGTYTHIYYNPQCTSNITLEFFETLELAAYEVAIGHQKNPAYTTRLVLALMSALAKLASRSQDLIPRALLCLNKLVQTTTAENSMGTMRTGASRCKAILGHASELVNVLKMPTIAIQVLSPTPSKKKGSDELQVHTTRVLQSVVRLLQTNIEPQNLSVSSAGPS